MIEIGKRSRLIVLRTVDFGVYLDGENLGDILLPARYIAEPLRAGDAVDVFIYNDSEDRLIATTEHPFAEVNTVAFLEVAASNRYGTFLNWGLPKDLLVPFREQNVRMREGVSYPVFVYLDHNTRRIVASSKIEHFLNNRPPEYSHGDKVDILVYKETEIGYKVVVDNLFTGMLYKNEVFTPLRIGSRAEAYIKLVRPDGKIDLTLGASAAERTDDLAQRILNTLKERRRLPLSDRSSPAEITAAFACSKKDFKRAIGNLYRRRLININPDSIELV